MELKNIKTSLYTYDINQAIKYLTSKGLKLAENEFDGNLLYVDEYTFSIVKIPIKGSNYKVINAQDFSDEINKPIKDSHGKLFYELDWRFIQQIAERLSDSKGKYPLYNWKKKMDDSQIEEIKQAVTRHFIEFIEGNYEDDGRPFGHIEAIVTNLMIVNYQLHKR